MSEFILGDCMDYLPKYKDNQFQLAIVDPEYGIGMSGGNVGYNGNNHLERKHWDNAPPPKEYFCELKRVSVDQIIWGGNYFKSIWPTRGFVVWDKGPGFKNRTYAESELAFTSFDRNAKTFSYDPLARGDYKGKIHPTQKPVALYTWLLQNYAKIGDTILDTHTGSASSLIACEKLGFEYTAFEKDKDYYKDAQKRLEVFRSQVDLFQPKDFVEPVQERLEL